jgi:hypothetical protein
MTIGPLELLVIGYEGTAIPERIGHELGALEHAGSVRIVDLAVIAEEEGVPSVRPARELSDEELRPFVGALGDLMGLLHPEELERAVASLPGGGRAVVVLVEHTWATGVRDALAHTGATLLIDELLSHEAVEARNAELAEFELVGE